MWTDQLNTWVAAWPYYWVRAEDCPRTSTHRYQVNGYHEVHPWDNSDSHSGHTQVNIP